MAKSDKNKDLTDNKRISGLLDFIQNGMKSMYRDTYQNQRTNNDDIDNIANDITSSISSMNTIGSEDNMSISNITKLYSKIKLSNNSGDDTLATEVLDVFNDKTITDQILSHQMDNKYIVDYDNEVDTVCKYMPKLDEALDAKKDSVLSADHFSKEYLTVKNTIDSDKESIFNKRVENILKEYKIPELFEEIYDAASKYGECFVYVVPYKQAFKELLQNRPELGNTGKNFHKLDPFSGKAVKTVKEMTIITENGKLKSGDKVKPLSEITDLKDIPKLDVLFDRSGLLESAVIDQYTKEKVLNNNRVRNTGLYESFINEMGDTITEAKGSFKVSDNMIPSDLELPDEEDKISTDGFIDKDNKRIDIKVPGCIIKKLKRENIIPIYIDDLCLGYYYLEFQESNPFYNNTLLSSPQVTQSFNKSVTQIKDEVEANKLLSYISGILSDNIDSNFINANQDLRKEIYMILKHNDIFNKDNGKKIKISFLPESDVFHVCWKKDPNTHRGISDLDKSLLPAKLYACLYITNTIGILTRGNDKRIYYVKQAVDTNISKTMLNLISQIKQSNFNLRQMESLNNVLNITGRYNDLVIPKNQNGEAPVEFEVMNGQNIEFKTELMNALEEMAINPIMPLELIQARQSLDYAIQITMSNSNYLRKVYKRQAISEEYFSQILSRVYNCEYEESNELDMSLPAPSFLNLTNMSQLMNNTREYVQSIIDTDLATESDEVKAKFMKKMMRHHLSTHINSTIVDKFTKEAKTEIKVEEDLGKINNSEE